LIDTSRAGAAPASAAAPDADLLARARSALAARDLDAYRACAPETASLADEHRRYVARRGLVEAGLQATAGVPAATAAAILQATAEVALDVLEPRPAEPVLLNLAGVALYELGALRGAEALFRAVKELDPAHEHVAGNLRGVKRARKAGRRVVLPPPVARALPALERRAQAVARAAGPGEVETISLCMIVRDEEHALGRCLASVAGVVDEIIVVDTGSTDRTMEIAREHGARVLEHPWNDDFSAARNVALEAATGAWILHLDADEALCAEDAPRLRELTRRTWREGFRLTLENRKREGTFVHRPLRLFRNRPQYRYVGRVHEDVLRQLPADAPERVEDADIRVEHYGYLRGVRLAKDKTRRNLTLLERQLAEEGPSLPVHFYLGTEYVNAGDRTRALDHFGRAWDLLLADPNATRQPIGPPLAARYASTLRQAGRLDAAASVAEHGLRLYERFTDLVFEQALIARARGELQRAEELFTRCLELGDAPAAYAHAAGAGTFLAATQLGELLAARGDLARAEALLVQTLADHPERSEPIGPLCRVMLARDASPDTFVARVLEHVEATPSMRFALGTALHEAGRAAEAEAQLRLALEADPEAAPVRLALAETLLSQARFAEAAATAAAIPDDSPWAAMAARTQAFAAIVAGDGAAEALARAERTGTPEHERRLLAAWAAQAAGAPDAGPLPRAALGLLLTAMEALLRVQEFDAFATLLPLVERIEGLSPRERRERMAQLYLRRGFLDSAAEEWMAVLDEHGPDAAALAGMAQVAAARGEADDARLFAEGALELDPGSARAAQVLEALAVA
jgi:tetratricopeptide (TPR) repeat protein